MPSEQMLTNAAAMNKVLQLIDTTPIREIELGRLLDLIATLSAEGVSGSDMLNQLVLIHPDTIPIEPLTGDVFAEAIYRPGEAKEIRGITNGPSDDLEFIKEQKHIRPHRAIIMFPGPKFDPKANNYEVLFVANQGQWDIYEPEEE